MRSMHQAPAIETSRLERGSTLRGAGSTRLKNSLSEVLLPQGRRSYVIFTAEDVLSRLHIRMVR